MIKYLEKEDFKELTSKGTILVDFYADWCGPCKLLGPVLEKISKSYPDITFIKVNVDDNEQLAVDFGILSIPAVFMLKDGKPVNKFVGSLPESRIVNILEETFK